MNFVLQTTRTAKAIADATVNIKPPKVLPIAVSATKYPPITPPAPPKIPSPIMPKPDTRLETLRVIKPVIMPTTNQTNKTQRAMFFSKNIILGFHNILYC